MFAMLMFIVISLIAIERGGSLGILYTRHSGDGIRLMLIVVVVIVKADD
jgi:hypothetical protein